MATPAFRRLRGALPGAFIGALLRPGLDELVAGSDFFDELHVDRAQGVMGPKVVASRLRPRRYDAAVLFTNSFSTALITRLAFIPRRIGYDRDGRGVLLTDRLRAPKRPDGRWACVPAVDYYLRLADAVLDEPGPAQPALALELATTPEQELAADRLLSAAGASDARPFAVLNPGANNASKRWPAERFGRLGAWLHASHGLRVLVNGSPGEREVVDRVVAAARESGGEQGGVVGLAGLGTTVGSLKALIRRAAVLVTNDTGPRHIAAAFGVPTVTLFGPTDPRWTTLPTPPAGAGTGGGAGGGPGARIDLTADPTLPAEEVADDHPDRCRIDRVTIEAVMEAVESVLGARQPARGGGG